MKVLLVDDKTENLQVGKEQIETLFTGTTVDTANNFMEAVRLLVPGHTYSAVLTDLQMPICEVPAFHSEDNRKYDPTQIVPYGLIIALRAALTGAKHVAIVTDGGHHASAMNAAIEYLAYGACSLVSLQNGPSYEALIGRFHLDGTLKPNFEINGAKMVIVADSKLNKGINEGFQGALKVLLQ